MNSEEKLLKLIRKQDKTVKIAVDKKGKNSKKQSVVKGVSFFKNANRILLLGALGILCFLGYRYYQMDSTPAISIVERSSSSQKTQVPGDLEEVRPFSDYRSQYQERNLFQYPWIRDKENPAENTQPIEKTFPLQNRLKIVGVVLDKNSKAIIEDMQSKETLFLSVGEEIAGAVVQDIFEEKVIFKYNNEIVELAR